MGITVLGPLTVDGSSPPTPRDRVVLQALATRVGRPVGADQLADALWGDHPPASAAKILQGCVVRLRKKLGPEAITTTPKGYTLTLDTEQVDAVRFEGLVVRARELLTLGEADRVAYQLTEALALWNGAPYAEVPDWPPAAFEARRLEELRLEAEELRAEAHLLSGRHREVLSELPALVHAAPLRERRWMLLALAQYQAGNQGEALRTIHRLRRVLSEQLGIDPGPDVGALEQSILRQEVSRPPEAVAGGPGSSCPWQGLRTYDVADAERFFGREQELDACLAIVRRTSALVLVGPSGSGKSSMLRAGVAATLQGRGRPVIMVTPGRRPLESLTGLEQAPAGAVLCVDQCEEVFSLCEAPEERRAFLDALTVESERRPVLVAIRADRLADVSNHARFSRLVERGLYLVGGMDETGLRQAVEGPARQSGLLMEPGLIDLLVREVQDDPGALPLLSHALLETWKRREGNTLTVAGYRATGGIHGAVAQSAEQLYARVDVEDRRRLRDLILRLLAPGSDGAPVRTRVPRRLVATDLHHDRLIEMLVAARLVTSDDGVLEVTHEALGRAWPRLRGWLDDDVEGQRVIHHLAVAADAWDRLGRPDSELYRGVRLARALDWDARSVSALTKTERDFLAAARAAAEAEERSAADRARAQARLIARLRLVLSGAVVLLVLALVAGGIAAVQSERASGNAARALANETAAEARRAGAQALATGELDESMLLAVAGVGLDDSPETRSSLDAALARHPELIASTPLGGVFLKDFDVSSDGGTVATFDEANQVRLFSIGTGDLLAEFSAGTTRRRHWTSNHVTFDPAGDTVAVLTAAPTRHPVRLLDGDNLEALPAQPRGLPDWRWQGDDAAFSQDGRRLAVVLERVQGAGSGTGRTTTWVVVWDLDAARQPITRTRLSEYAGGAGVAFSDDGRSVLTSAPLTVHDLETGDSRGLPEEDEVAKLAISPDGRLVAASLMGSPGGLVLLDAVTGEQQARLASDGAFGWNVEFSGDGRRVATVLFDLQEAAVWDVDTGRAVARIPLDEQGESLALSRDGSTLYTSGTSGSLRQWDVDGTRRFLAQVATSKPKVMDYLPAQPAPGGGHIALPGDVDVTFFDVEAGATTGTLPRGTGYGRPTGSWHPDGMHYALATAGQIRVWDAPAGELVARGRGPGRWVTGLDHSTDGTRIVTGDLSGRVTMLDADTLSPVGRDVLLERPVCCVAAGPDNRTAVALTGPFGASPFYADSADGWALVDLSSGTVVATGALEIEGRHVDVSPDGHHAAVAGRGGLVEVLDLTTAAPVAPPVVVASESVSAVTYSPDGTRIVASSDAASVALLDGSTGRVLASVQIPQAVTEAGFGDTAETVVIATMGPGPVWRWDTRVDYAMDFACRVAGRGFTEAEWSTLFGERPYNRTCPDT